MPARSHAKIPRRNYNGGPRQPSSIIVVILAGGASSRMGRSKAPLRLGRQSLLQRTRESALAANFNVHVVRRDILPKCGPIGGIYTALARYRAEAVLFLPCDMPFVSPLLLRQVAAMFLKKHHPVFTRCRGRAGFPCVIPRKLRTIIRRRIDAGEYSLHSLAKALDAAMFDVPSARAIEVFNINTPGDYEVAQRRWKTLE